MISQPFSGVTRASPPCFNQWRHQGVTTVLQQVASPGRHHRALPVPRAAFPIALRTSLRTKRVRCGCQGRCQEIWRGGGVPFQPTIEKWSSVKATQSVVGFTSRTVGFPTRGPYCSTGSGYFWGLTSDFERRETRNPVPGYATCGCEVG